MQSLWQATDGLPVFFETGLSFKERAMTTATTLNGFDRSLISGAAGGSYQFKAPSLRKFSPVMPEMPSLDSKASVVAGVAGRLALAAIPFAGLGWLFISR
jgi:hypothetical protein